MDPYKVLNVSRNCSIEQLRDAFKKVAIKVHPDKGGNQELFNIVVESYKTIFQKLKGQSGNKDFNELKNESRREFSTMKKTKHVSFKLDDDQEGFQKKFNKVFDENRFHDSTVDEGYGHMMREHSAVREDIDIKRKVKNFKDFNSAFDEQEVMNKEMVIYKEPEALVLSKSLAYNELGVDRIDDYSSDTTKSSALGYCDYMKAHTTNKLVDKRYLKQHETFKNMNDIEQKREAQSFALSDEDRRVIEAGLKKEKEQEMRRQVNVQEYDKNIQKHFEKVNKLMIGQFQ